MGASGGCEGGGFLVVVMQCRSYAVMQGGGRESGEWGMHGEGGGVALLGMWWWVGGGGGVCQYTAFIWGAVDTRAPCGSGQLYN